MRGPGKDADGIVVSVEQTERKVQEIVNLYERYCRTGICWSGELNGSLMKKVDAQIGCHVSAKNPLA